MRSKIKGLFLLAALCFGPGIAIAGPVNINTADEDVLVAELNGIGPSLAAAIVRDREENGRYESPEQLTRVRGIGQRVLENNQDFILVEDEESDSK